MRAVRSILLFHAVRAEEPLALERICAALRERWPGATIVAAAPSRAAWLSDLSGADDVLVMGPWRRTLSKIRARRFDAACIVYDAPSLPGPTALEAVALASGCGRLTALAGGGVVGLSRIKVGLRVAAGLVTAAVLAAAGAAAAVIVSGFLIASALTGRSK
jgi:hypothetical protein